MRPERTSTIEKFIESSPSSAISYDKLSLLEKYDDMIMISYNVINDYIDELDKLAVTVVLSDSEYNRYMFRPKLLAYDVYGSTELYFIILTMNNICNVKEFNFKKIKMLKAQDLEAFISAVYNSERGVIISNRDKIK